MKKLSGKKLLVLGGAFQHCKLVEAAHELGVEVIVTDYLPVEQAPAKQIADKYYMYNITDIDEIVGMCIKENVDGVLSTSLDACQKPYQQICERLGLPCFGNKEQFKILTNKKVFKEYCLNNGVDVIPEYSVFDFIGVKDSNKNIEYPVFVKPSDSRGSRGQSVCYNYEETVEAIEFAREESLTGNVVIERYMGQENDFSVISIVLNGKVYPFRTVDRILGSKEDGLDKLAVGAIMPSKHTEVYLKEVHSKIEKFISNIGIKNAPLFLQGFVDGNTVRFYDPGLRLPGSEYERIFKSVTGKDVLYPLIEFAVTGKISNNTFNLDKDVYLNEKYGVQLFPALKEGCISQIMGIDILTKHPKIVSVFAKQRVGDVVQATHNVNQRFCEIDMICDSIEDIKNMTDYVYETLSIIDENGENMIITQNDVNDFLNNGYR